MSKLDDAKAALERVQRAPVSPTGMPSPEEGLKPPAPKQEKKPRD